jgi:transcriptional regulator GlxA family with amidase domain
VAALAAAAGQGVDAFHRAFRAGSGQTPAQFLIERRVARAAGLLTGGDMPLAGIARACGFPNRHYLTRMFTRRMGASPAAYRRLHRA